MIKIDYLRLVSYPVFFTAIFVFPWWFSLILGVGAIFYFNRYYEIVFFAFLVDTTYAVPLGRFYEFVLIATFFSLISVVLVEFLKTRIYLYD